MKSKFKLSTGQMGRLEAAGAEKRQPRPSFPEGSEGVKSRGFSAQQGSLPLVLGAFCLNVFSRAHPLRLALRTTPPLDEPSPLKTPPPQPLLLLGALCHDGITTPTDRDPAPGFYLGQGVLNKQVPKEQPLVGGHPFQMPKQWPRRPERS